MQLGAYRAHCQCTRELPWLNSCEQELKSVSNYEGIDIESPLFIPF
jgi:hypothetical protein